MNILILHNSYQHRGGEDAVVDAESKLLSERGHKVHVHKVHNDEINTALDKFRVAINTPYSANQKKNVLKLSNELSADIVHVHNFFPLLTPGAHEGARYSGAAVVQTLHNYRLLCANALFLREGKICQKCLGNNGLPAVLHRCYRNSFTGSAALVAMQQQTRRNSWENVDQFIAISEFMRQKLIEGRISDNKISVKPNFVDSRINHPAIEKRRNALFVGRLSTEKGVDVLIDAWRRMPDHRLIVVGDGPERQRLVEIAPHNVSFTGPLPPQNVMDLMRQSEFLVVPSICFESFGLVVAEAYSVGTPVIASRIGALEEIVIDGATGKLFEPGSSDDLVRVVSEFIGTNRSEFMGKTARSVYESEYTPDKNVLILEEIYNKAIKIRNSYNSQR